MSSLKANQIKAKLRSMFEPHLDLSDISSTDKEREVKILSRCLAAFAIYHRAGCSEADAAKAVWDGGDDNGIDAAFFDASESRVLFVQSKWISKGTGEPEARDIGAFVKGVRDAIEQDDTCFHTRLHVRLNDILLRLMTPGTSVQLIVISTGASSLARHATKVIEGFVDEVNGGEDPIASSEVIGLKEVYTGLARDGLQGNVTLDANILDWSFISNPYPAYVGVIDGSQLKEWWKMYGKRLVSSNIRHALGATEVNNQIRQTATNTPERFWYFNNGITLIAEEAIKAPASTGSRSAGIFSFRGASIVNGAQTVSSLGKVDNDAALGSVRVTLRVILLKTAPPGFGSEVTRTNNLQNRIEPRDFAAQDPEQTRIREEMFIQGIDYQFVRSEEIVSTVQSCDLIEVTTALACANGDSNLAVHVKTGIGRFFTDLTKAPYKTVFNPSTTGARAYNATVVLRQIDSWIERRKRNFAKRSGQPWGVLVHGNRILAASVFKQLGDGLLTKSIEEFRQGFKTEEVEQMCEDVYAKMIKAIGTHYPGKVLGSLFKNPTMSRHVFDLSSAK